ncbi:MAG: hypothetical protein DRJ65_11720 [Acidobacteria bacterium]|nr:MAG: hypothetical protein DRJ65_11720 [Acidobacteriota bacterium]
MNKRIMVSLCVCCLVLGAVTLVSAERPKPAEKLAVEGPDNSPTQHTGPAIQKLETPVQTRAPKNRIVGMITYDDGVAMATGGVASHSFGNQFSTAAGSPVMASGSVTQMQVYMMSVAGTAAFVSVYGPVSGTAAPFLTSVNVPMTAGAWNTHTFAAPVAYTGASFLAGVWLNAATGTIDAVGLGSGTAGGQGFHGMHINDIAGTGFSAPGTFNALVRAGGDVLVPVELMSFSVE